MFSKRENHPGRGGVKRIGFWVSFGISYGGIDSVDCVIFRNLISMMNSITCFVPFIYCFAHVSGDVTGYQRRVLSLQKALLRHVIRLCTCTEG